MIPLSDLCSLTRIYKTYKRGASRRYNAERFTKPTGDNNTKNNVTKYVRGTFNKFPAFFVQAFKIVVDTWKFTMLLLYILWDDWPIFMISGSNEQLQQQLEYNLLKPDCHSW